MITAWMIYGSVIAVTVLVTAVALDRLTALLGRPTRWVWLAAIGVSTVLIAVAPLRLTPATDGSTVGDPAQALATATPGAMASVAPTTVHPIRATMAAVSRNAMALAQWRASRAVDASAAGAWLAASLFFLTLFCIVQLRFRRAKAKWPLRNVHGTMARIAPNVGPAVIGFRPSEIVIPQWLLLRGAEEQRLVIAHEREHLRAGDPLLLGAGWLAVTLLPWNPAVWYMASRLRLAVEIDCDTRILRHGVPPRAYGTLLIELAARCSGLASGAPAFAERPTQLEQRLIAMRPRRDRFVFARGVAYAAVAGLALAAGSAIRMPEAADAAQPPPSMATPTLDLPTVASIASPAPAESSVPRARDTTTQPVAAASQQIELQEHPRPVATDVEKIVIGASLDSTLLVWYLNDAPVSADSARAALPGTIRVMRTKASATGEADIRLYTERSDAGAGVVRGFTTFVGRMPDSAITQERGIMMKRIEIGVAGRASASAVALDPALLAEIKAKLAGIPDSAERNRELIETLKSVIP